MTRRSGMAIGPLELQQLVANCWLVGMSLRDVQQMLCSTPRHVNAAGAFYASFEYELDYQMRLRIKAEIPARDAL